MKMRTRCHRCTGFALPLVLWLIAILMMMVAVVAYSAKVGHIEGRAQYDRAEAEAAAKAGIAYAVARSNPVLATEAWGPRLEAYALQLDGWSIRITIRDEAGKFDLNHGDPELLRALMQVEQVPADQAARLIAGLQTSRQRNLGAVNPLPHTPGAPPATSDGKRERIVSVSELRQWPGIAPATLQRLRDELTVHGEQAVPQWRLASASMKRALANNGQVGVETAPVAGPEFGSGIYAIESVAERPGRSPGRVFAVLRVSPRAQGGMTSIWLAWEHGRWMQ